MKFKIRKPIKLPSPNIVRKHIAELLSIDLQSADIECLKASLEPLFRGYVISTPIIQTGEKLFRGALKAKQPTSIKDLSYPPVEAIPYYQRANRPHKPMLYASVAREAPFFELSLKANDHVAISKWKTKRKIIVNNVGYSVGVFNRLSSDRILPPWKAKHSALSSPSNVLVDEFFAQQFAKIVPTGHDYEYKMSVAIAEKLYQGQLKLDPRREAIDAEVGLGGIIYPAIAMRAKADNVALLPHFVDQYLDFISVEWIRVEALQDHDKYQITMLDFANSVGPSGELEWKGRLPQWQIMPGQTVVISVEHGKYVVKNERGEVTEPS